MKLAIFFEDLRILTRWMLVLLQSKTGMNFFYNNSLFLVKQHGRKEQKSRE